MTWKACERAIAKRFNGKRIGNSGSNTADVVAKGVSIEVKMRRVLPKWIVDAVEQACRNAIPGTMPFVVLHQTGDRHDDDIVCMRLSDFEDWHGKE